MTSYVKCLKCQRERRRPSNFYDINLSVKNEFENVYNDSLEKAIFHYLQPEKLDGSNQVYCEHCDSKEDAEKGDKFEKLPKVLCLQLQRFTLDMQTFNRKKLNDRVSFPLYLNMNRFLSDQKL